MFRINTIITLAQIGIERLRVPRALKLPVTYAEIALKQRDNEYHIRTEYDPVSILHTINPMRNNKNTTTIKSDSLNLLNKHKTDTLNRLDPELEFGGSIKSKKLNSMDKVREFLKKYKL